MSCAKSRKYHRIIKQPQPNVINIGLSSSLNEVYIIESSESKNEMLEIIKLYQSDGLGHMHYVENKVAIDHPLKMSLCGLW